MAANMFKRENKWFRLFYEIDINVSSIDYNVVIDYVLGREHAKFTFNKTEPLLGVNQAKFEIGIEHRKLRDAMLSFLNKKRILYSCTAKIEEMFLS